MQYALMYNGEIIYYYYNLNETPPRYNSELKGTMQWSPISAGFLMHQLSPDNSTDDCLHFIARVIISINADMVSFRGCSPP